METVDNTEKKYTEEDLLHFVAFVLNHQLLQRPYAGISRGDFKALVKVAYNEFSNFKNMHRVGQRLFRNTNEQEHVAIDGSAYQLTAPPSRPSSPADAAPPGTT